MIAKDDFVQWRNLNVTQELKGSLLEAIANASTEVMGRWTPDIDRDQFLKGMIWGMNMAIEWIPEFEPSQEITSEEEE